jgi:uncharacterized PurR-regulated membrane protein YhhQ (DUF165 family)
MHFSQCLEMMRARIACVAKDGLLKAYEYRSINAEDALHAARHSDDPIWPHPVRAYGGPTETTHWQLAAKLALAAGRLLIPVSLLLVLLGAAYLYSDDLLPLQWAPASFRNAGLATGDLILPGCWYCIQLTNRRYGSGYALAHLLAAMVVGLGVIVINPGSIDERVITMPAITGRAVLSFGAAFVGANLVGITFFEAARGPRWATAPLMASTAASYVFSAIYYPAAFAGVYERWTDSAIAHLVVFADMSVLLLVPYWLLRPAMRPTNGMNGY